MCGFFQQGSGSNAFITDPLSVTYADGSKKGALLLVFLNGEGVWRLVELRTVVIDVQNMDINQRLVLLWESKCTHAHIHIQIKQTNNQTKRVRIKSEAVWSWTVCWRRHYHTSCLLDICLWEGSCYRFTVFNGWQIDRNTPDLSPTDGLSWCSFFPGTLLSLTHRENELLFLNHPQARPKGMFHFLNPRPIQARHVFKLIQARGRGGTKFPQWKRQNLFLLLISWTCWAILKGSLKIDHMTPLSFPWWPWLDF